MTSVAGGMPHVLIRASAGSGKTFQLSNRFLSLLFQGVPPERILAVTFTKKAAGEIFDRILYRLAQAAANDAARVELSQQFQREITVAECREQLARVLGSLHRFRVGTLDSFFANLASVAALELGLPLGWMIADETVDARYRQQALVETLTCAELARIRTLFHMLAKGDATRGIQTLLRDTVDNAYHTFLGTNEVAWKSFPNYAPLSETELQATLEHIGNLSQGQKTWETTCQSDLAKFMSGQWKEFLKAGLAACLLNEKTTYKNKPIPPELSQAYERLIQHVRGLLVTQLARQTEAAYDLLADFQVQYRRLKIEEGSLRFEDVTHLLAAAATTDHGTLRFRLDGRIDHLLLDEFQDTSLPQWQVLRPLAKRIVAARENTSFFCVGDVKQAIYGWRGGLAELFDAVEQELPGVRGQSLAKSFRSSPVVIEFVNRVFQNLHRHDNLEHLAEPIAKWTRKFEPHATAKTMLSGYITLETPWHIAEEEDVEGALLDYAADRIAETHRASPGRTVGVLVERNKTIGALIYRLRQRGVAASEEGGNPLTDSPAVELILSLVRLADYPGDRAAFFHVRQSPLGEPLELHADNASAVGLSHRVRRELLELGYGVAVERWSQWLAPACTLRDRSRLQQLVELAFTYQSQATLRPCDFVRFVETKKVADSNISLVSVTTIHKAKGLEYDIVFLPELDSRLRGQVPALVSARSVPSEPPDCVSRYASEEVQSLLPAKFQAMFEQTLHAEIQEAMCVLYVAITRAVHALHMIIKPWKDSEKHPPRSYAGLLRAALEVDPRNQQNTVVFEQGDPNWLAQAPPVKHVDLPTKSSSPLKIQLAVAMENQSRGIERASPSALEGGPAAVQSHWFRLDDEESRFARLRGTALHACFEKIFWLDDGLPNDAALLHSFEMNAELSVAPAAWKDRWLADFYKLAQASAVRESLQRTSYLASLPKSWQKFAATADLQARNEYPFAQRLEGRLLQGRIDRVVIFLQHGQPVAVDILDYKTDTISHEPGHTLSARVEFYRPQLEAYARLIATRFQLERSFVGAGLLFLGANQFHRLQ